MFYGTKVPWQRKFSLQPFRSRKRKCWVTKSPDCLWMFHPFNVSPPRRFAHFLNVSPLGHLATWTFCSQDISPSGRFAPRTFCTLYVSPTHLTFCPRKWTFRRLYFCADTITYQLFYRFLSAHKK